MKNNTSADTAAVVLLTLGIAGGIVELFFRPFGIGPFAFLAVLIGSAISNKHRRLGMAATAAVGICFLVGASIAIWNSSPLY